MATPVLSNGELDTSADDQHLETFSLIWLDTNMNVKETRNTEEKLRSIINHLKKFPDVKQCQEYIEQRSQEDRLVLIVSGRMGQEMVPVIHHLRQVISIYVYCTDKKKNEEWSCKFPKVKGVAVDADELISRIAEDHQVQKKIDEPLSINIFTTEAGANKSTTGVNGQFVFSQVLIDCLLRLKSTERDKNELIDCCTSQYEGNQSELNKIREFQEHYSPDKALWWYTRESFFYKTLNAALRTQNIHMIFLFRTFIADMYRQLKSNQVKNPLRVYRSQLISIDELDSLKKNISQFISVNSFFSTSDDRTTAFFLLGDPHVVIDLERVLFEIDADPNIITSKSFADISSLSHFPIETEILFMLGSIFRLESIIRDDDNNVWIIRMTLCGDDEHELKQVLMYMKQQIGTEETNLRTLGKILSDMGKFDLAEKYFTRLSKQILPDDPLLTDLYEELGKVASQRGDYDMSMQWHQKSLAFKQKHHLTINSKNNGTNDSLGQQIIVSSLHAKKINATQKQGVLTVAGGKRPSNGLAQLPSLSSLQIVYVDDDDQRIYTADYWNHRIVEWKCGEKNGQVVAGGNGPGDRMNQLRYPTDVIVDHKTDSLIICDSRNRRVVRWPRQNGANGQIIISNVACKCLSMDEHGDLYVSDSMKNEVRRWKIQNNQGTIVAGGNGEGNQFNQLDCPSYFFVDEDQSVYVSDWGNHRVMKWLKGAKEGILVAGGHGEGDHLTQLNHPEGVTVDQWGDLYVADSDNVRIMRWPKGSQEGSIVFDGNSEGNQTNQFSHSTELSFDQHGHLYVVNWENHRVQKFHVSK